jgi:hypothetical protein
MRLKLIGDGTPTGTRVMTEDGQTIDNVEFVELSIDARSGVTGTIRFITLNVDLELRAGAAG